MSTENLGIGLDAYARHTDGFGQGSLSELQNLQKALSADQITGRTTDGLLTPGSGAPLKVESLEKSLKVLTYKESDITLWKAIPKLPAYNTVEEYNRLVDYGTQHGGFNVEGELPQTEDSTYQRASQLVKFLGITREVTHPMTLVRTNIGSAIQAEVRNGTMWILRKVDSALTNGNSVNVPVEFNGLYQQHSADFTTPAAYHAEDTVIDLRGKTLAEGDVESGVRTIIDKFGSADELWAPPIVLSNFVKTFYSDLRQYAPVPSDSKVGRRISAFQSQFGEIKLNFDKFMNRLPAKTTASLPSFSGTAHDANAPTDVSSVLVLADASSLWQAADAGDYVWAVTAVNRYGESALTVLNAGTPLTVAVGDSVDLTWTDAGGNVAATAYRVYRSEQGVTTVTAATKFYPMFDISVAEHTAGYDGGAAGVVRDRNRIIPNTDQAFMLENSEDIWSVKQLAPLMKMDIAVLAPAYRFMILLYCTMMAYQPRKVVRFINIGTRP